MHDFYLFFTPAVMFLVVALAGFVGCDMYVDPVPVVNAAPPSNLVASSSSSRVDLAWNASPDAAVDGYNVRRGMTSGQYTLTIPADRFLTYTDLDVVNGVTYFYVVTALVRLTESRPTNEVAVTPQ